MQAIKPQLRFPGFTDEWQVKQLGDYIISLDAGVSVNSDDKPTDGTVPGILKTSCVTSGEFNPNENKRVVADGEIKRLKEPVTADTIIISRMNTPDLVGANAYVSAGNDNLYLPDRLWATKISSNASAKFIAYKLGSKKYRQRLSSLATGTSNSMKNISKDGVRGLEVIMPPKPEQEKITDFLTAVDERIAASERRYELLTLYKRGVMQQLFSQKIRFKKPDGTNYPNWEEKPLSQVSRRITQRNKSNDVSFVLTNSATAGVVSQTEYFDKNIANANNLTNYYIVEKGDFVYNPRISVHAPVGPIKRNNLATGVMSPLYSVFTITAGNSTFYEQYFATNYWHDYMRSIANYGARHDRMNITTSDFYKMPLPFPCEEEQQKIADFLVSLDARITAERTKLTTAKQFKKALLQWMFV